MGRRAAQVMGAGFSAAQAIAINGSLNATLSAAGTTQGTATAATGGNNIVTTVASGTGVILPQGQPGDEIEVFNGGANALAVYPPTGAHINLAGANTADTINTGILRRYKQISTTFFVAD